MSKNSTPELRTINNTELSAYLIGEGADDTLVVGGIGSHPEDFRRLADATGKKFWVVQNPFHDGTKSWNSCEDANNPVPPLIKGTKKSPRIYPQGWRPWWHQQLGKVFRERPWKQIIGHSGASEPILEQEHQECLRRIVLIGSPTVQSLRIVCNPPLPTITDDPNEDNGIKMLKTALQGLCARMDQEIFDATLLRHAAHFGTRFQEIMYHEDPKMRLPSFERARNMVEFLHSAIEVVFVKDALFDPWHDEQRFYEMIHGLGNVRGVNCKAGHYGHIGDVKTVAEAVNAPFAPFYE